MDNAGVLIMFAVLGTYICAKARVPGGAVAFALIGLVLFCATPVGSGLPGAVSRFVDVVDQSTTPPLTQRADIEDGAE